jgi:hypothetical protein
VASKGLAGYGEWKSIRRMEDEEVRCNFRYFQRFSSDTSLLVMEMRRAAELKL